MRPIPFKAGDIIECVDNGLATTELTVGNLYEVDFTVRDFFIKLKGFRYNFAYTRFKHPNQD